MVRQFDAAEAMSSHRRAAADWLNAKRPTPPSGYVSFCAVFALSENNDTSVSPYFSQVKSASKIAIILPHVFMLRNTSPMSFHDDRWSRDLRL
jgi:hypothetical protein